MDGLGGEGEVGDLSAGLRRGEERRGHKRESAVRMRPIHIRELSIS